jgi:hypothetical protein
VNEIAGMVTIGIVKADAAICTECLTLCREIHAENLT